MALDFQSQFLLPVIANFGDGAPLVKSGERAGSSDPNMTPKNLRCSGRVTMEKWKPSEAWTSPKASVQFLRTKVRHRGSLSI